MHPTHQLKFLKFYSHAKLYFCSFNRFLAFNLQVKIIYLQTGGKQKILGHLSVGTFLIQSFSTLIIIKREKLVFETPSLLVQDCLK